ncbi:MAG: hypothetical protein JWP13_501, partial [Candidatus Saccharibacteria bacterium]|nr:hypothetical protein [Candidatus Saccharibacteria bacterium]
LTCLALYACLGPPTFSDSKPESNPLATKIASPTITNMPTPMTTEMPSPSPVETTNSAPASTTERQVPAGCSIYFNTATYQNNEYEVCTAYVVNAAEVALQGMYKFGNNSFDIPAQAARHHFETRFWGEPRQSVENEVATWPETDRVLGNSVEESVSAISVTVDLQDNRALLSTEESWKVTAPDGTVLHDDQLHVKDITMCSGKLPGHPLHEWMVVSRSRLPDFDCTGFDRANGIEP